MTEEPTTDTSTPLARWIAAVLRVGTLAAVAVIAAGYAWALLSEQPSGGTTPVVEEIVAGGGDGLAAIGLLALTLVPIVMLVAAAVALARMGERRMAAVTAIVGVLLVASLGAAAVIGPAI